MTREEAIGYLFGLYVVEHQNDDYEKGLNEALDLAIEALSAPQTDLISRADAMRKIKNAENELTDECERKGVRVARFIIGELPSAEAKDCESIELLASGDVIYRADAIEAIDKVTESHSTIDSIKICAECRDELFALPSAEAEQGEWVDDTNTQGYVYCSQCNKMFNAYSAKTRYNYCPSCGARMKGGDNE